MSHQLIQVGEHIFQTPEQPLYIDEVLFSKELPRNQYWDRKKLLKDFPKYFFDWNSDTKLYQDHSFYDNDGILVALNSEESKNLIRLRDRELKRRVQGVWMMNNGELTFLTGGNYFFLMWGALYGYADPEDGSPYGQYREYQRDYAYFTQICRTDPRTMGGFIVKPKKTGISQYHAIEFLDMSTRFRTKVYGMMSNTQDNLIEKTGFMFYKYAMSFLPNIMRPSIQKDNKELIIFGPPNTIKNRNRKSELKMRGNSGLEQEDYLYTQIMACATMAGAMDGPQIKEAWLDEPAKYEKTAYAEEVYVKTLAACKLQQQKVGTLFMTNYVPETDKERSFLECKEIFYKSLLKTKKSEGGRTASELYAYLIPISESVYGNFDIYGKPDRKKNMIYYQNGIENARGDKNKILEFRRQNPQTIDDCWMPGGGGGSVFDNVRLGAQANIIQERLDRGDLSYVPGELQFMGDINKTPEYTGLQNYQGKKYEHLIRFVPTLEKDLMNGRQGRFRIYGMDDVDPDSFNIPLRKGLRDRHGRLKPAIMSPYAIGMDPTNYAIANMIGKGSRNAIYVMIFPDAKLDAKAERRVTDRILLEYLFRADKPQDTYLDVLKVILWTGAYILCEGNMSWIITKLIEDGFGNFVMVMNNEGAYEPYNAGNKQKYPTTQGRGKGGQSVVERMVMAIIKNLQEPETEMDYDNVNNLESKDLIDGLMIFDKEDTTERDEVMGYGHALLNMEAQVGWRIRDARKAAKQANGGMEAAIGMLK